ncbi:hypothetical protein DM785_08370 [Deinococcus actinosclerus]|nr:hypothetical protein DM785_08370 [Deinococcus actinosclerus]
MCAPPCAAHHGRQKERAQHGLPVGRRRDLRSRDAARPQPASRAGSPAGSPARSPRPAGPGRSAAAPQARRAARPPAPAAARVTRRPTPEAPLPSP